MNTLEHRSGNSGALSLVAWVSAICVQLCSSVVKNGRGIRPTLIVFSLVSAAALRAHNAPGSALLLDLHADRIGAELRLPLSELEVSFRAPLEKSPEQVVTRYRAELEAYVLKHISAQSEEGQSWKIAVTGMEVMLTEQPIDLIVKLELSPPRGASLRHFTLHSDVISHEVMNHFTMVSVRSDWNNALLTGEPEMLGVLRSYQQDLPINRSAGGAWTGFRSVLSLGMSHIAEGTDHLLFLLVLLLPAPLLVAGRRWGGYGGLRYSVVGLLKIISAFTAGHSLTLLVGALGWLRLPSQPVEVLIAVSILVSAVHAWRPIFAGREPLVALGFGLVHGLAFAAVLAEFHLDTWHFAAALLAFNLGIELMQLVVVATIVPWLVMLSRTRGYVMVRLAGAVFGGAAALGWVVERTVGWASPLNAVIDAAAAHAIWLAGLLAMIALSSAAWGQWVKRNEMKEVPLTSPS